jgi:hypothetical protein
VGLVCLYIFADIASAVSSVCCAPKGDGAIFALVILFFSYLISISILSWIDRSIYLSILSWQPETARRPLFLFSPLMLAIVLTLPGLSLGPLAPSGLRHAQPRHSRRLCVQPRLCAPSAQLSGFLDEVQQSLGNGSLVKLTLSGNDAQQRAAEDDPLHRLKRIEARSVQLKKGLRLQLMLKYEHRDTCVNVKLPEVGENLAGWLKPGAFRRGRLMSVDADLCLERRGEAGHALQRLKPTASGPPPDQAHDRQKRTPVPADAPFLRALGVTNEQGRPRPGKADKLRQIQKFVETLTALLRKSGLTAAPAVGGEGGEALAPQPLRIVDAGCGRGYLTFAAHAHLSAEARCEVETCGVELRSDLVREMNGLASSLDGFETLRFEQGALADLLRRIRSGAEQGGGAEEGGGAEGGAEGEGRAGGREGGAEGEAGALGIDVLLALHACDTATDDALWCGVKSGAAVIVVAPCCHKEVRRLMERGAPRGPAGPGPLAAALRHGIYRERTAEMLTDAMRALLLEMAGYEVSVFEFIGGEHTAKNVMITAVRLPSRRAEPEALAQRRAQLRALCDDFGIESQALAAWMGEVPAAANAAHTALASAQGQALPLQPPGERTSEMEDKPTRRAQPRTL